MSAKISLIYIGPPENAANMNALMQDTSFEYEVIEHPKNATGNYVAFVGFKDRSDRLHKQVEYLNANEKLVGCGTCVQTGPGKMRYLTAMPHLIESELLKGHLIIEPFTFMYKTALYTWIDDQPLTTDSFFARFCEMTKRGILGNIPEALTESVGYQGRPLANLESRVNYANRMLDEVINVVLLNASGIANYSGVDRYVDLLQEHMPSKVRVTKITFKIGSVLPAIAKVNDDTYDVYTPQADIEKMYDLVWNNLTHIFERHNLVVQSNCLSLHTFISYIRSRVKCVHICALHCNPYRELIRDGSKRSEYADLNKAFIDPNKDLPVHPESLKAFNLADYIFSPSADSLRYLKKIRIRTPASVIHHGVPEVGLYDRSPNDEFTFLFVGHDSPLKGYDQLLPIIREKGFHVKWVGSVTEATKASCKDLPIQFLGVVPRDKMDEVYRSSDCLVIASMSEGCSFAALEGMAHGLPIVATKALGLNETLDSSMPTASIDEAGIIDTVTMAYFMESMRDDADFREKQSQISYERSKEFPLDAMIQNTMNLWNALLRRNAGNDQWTCLI